MAPDDGLPLSLWPFPVADKEPKSLAEFIVRVNAQPGGFRAVSEAKLREEIKAREEAGGATEDADVDMADVDDDDAAKDPNVARAEVLKNIDVVGNTAMLTLDFLSLLLSKQNPTQASLTLSQQLRDMVGIGTLGADKLDESNSSEAKTKQQQEVAIGWTIMEINKTRDAVEDAAAFLEKEVEAENRYWEGVMAVKRAGWSICKVPQEKGTLGVRFGFSEASPEFKNNGLAPMRRGNDGSVELDLSRLGGVSEGIVVTLLEEGNVAGRSVPRWQSSGGDVSLESRVIEARNTIFSQELWHELTREARTLAAYDVRLKGSRLIYVVDRATSIVIELLPLASCPFPDDALPENGTAETISTALHILLSYAHRYNELMRTRPVPPHVSRSRGQQTYALIRPIIGRLTSMRSIQSCTRYVGGLVKALRAAGLAASFTLRTPQASASEPWTGGAPNQPPGAPALIRNMLQPLDFTMELTIFSGSSLTVRGRTFIFPVTATYYNVFFPPPSPLQKSTPPYADGYPDLQSLADYMRIVVARSLASHLLGNLPDPSQWTQNVMGTGICSGSGDTDKTDIQFNVVDEQDARSALVLTCSFVVCGVAQRKRWKWTSGVESESRPLPDVVTDVVGSSAA